MDTSDLFLLLHPLLAVTVVFPTIGIIVRMAIQTRQRRLKSLAGEKTAIPATVGRDHVAIGRWLSGSVVVLSLIGLAHPIFSTFIEHHLWTEEPFRVMFVIMIFAATSLSLFFLYKSKPKLWRGTFATLTGMGLIVLGSQKEIYKVDAEWYISHYYYGMLVSLLMIFSLAIIQDIHQDRTNRWRNVHIILNCFALLLFIGQGFTGAKSLLEIPIGWQKPYVESLYKYECNKKPCLVQPKTAPSLK